MPRTPCLGKARAGTSKDGGILTMGRSSAGGRQRDFERGSGNNDVGDAGNTGNAGVDDIDIVDNSLQMALLLSS